MLVYFWFFHRHLNYLPGESEYEAYFNHFSNSEKSFFLDEITLCGSCYLMRVIFFSDQRDEAGGGGEGSQGGHQREEAAGEGQGQDQGDRLGRGRRAGQVRT